jgi:hypothetical protein
MAWNAVKAAEFKNAKYAAQRLTALETCAFPVLGRMAFIDIGTSDLLQLLEPIWTTKTETRHAPTPADRGRPASKIQSESTPLSFSRMHGSRA